MYIWYTYAYNVHVYARRYTYRGTCTLVERNVGMPKQPRLSSYTLAYVCTIRYNMDKICIRYMISFKCICTQVDANLMGISQQPARWHKCVAATKSALPMVRLASHIFIYLAIYLSSIYKERECALPMDRPAIHRSLSLFLPPPPLSFSDSLFHPSIDPSNCTIASRSNTCPLR
jgi:hypothetical protein